MDTADIDYRQDPLLLQIEHKRLEVMLKLRKVRRDHGLDFYTPHAKQNAFHEAANYHYRYARTGNRFGKSQMGAAEDVSFAIGERRWYPKGDPRRTIGIPTHPTKGLIICVDWEKSEEIFTNVEGAGELGKLMQYIPNGALKSTSKNSSGYINKMVIARPNGPVGGESLIEIDTVHSYKQSHLSMESSVWDWIHIDEPCPKEMYVAAARGLVDRNGRTWFTCTPLTEPWINDLFVPNRRMQVEDGLPYINGNDKWMLVGSMYDNPYNTAEAIERFLSLLNPDELECRKNGIPLAMAGIVYKEYSATDHVYRTVPHGWEDFNRPPKDYTLRLSIDPHPQTPHAVVFIATSPEGYKFVFHEIFEHCMIKDLCSMIKAITEGYYVQTSTIDPAAQIKDPMTMETMMDEFYKNGVWVEPAIKDLVAGILSIKRHLRERTPGGKPTMYFSCELQRMPYEFDHYNWKQGSVNKPEDKDDHTLECLYRLCLGGLAYVAPPSDDAYAREYTKSIDEIIDEEVSDDVLLGREVSKIRSKIDFGSYKRRSPKTRHNDTF